MGVLKAYRIALIALGINSINFQFFLNRQKKKTERNFNFHRDKIRDVLSYIRKFPFTTIRAPSLTR